MPQGLQVWDADGVPQLDTSSQVSTFLAKIEAFTPNKTTTYTNTILSQGKPFYLVLPMASPYASTEIKVTMVGDTVTIVTNPLPWGATFTSWQFIVYIGIY